MSAGSEQTWAEFWRAGGQGHKEGAVPPALAGIDSAQTELWQAAARRLRKGSHVLDLATGDGVVLRKMRLARRDLKLIGVDSSAHLPAAPAGVELRTGVAMERLPFRPGTFDLVTSQFGYEYGATERTAAEVARILKPSGRFSFLVHHRDGPIVAHNEARRGALAWALTGSGLLDRARSLARARSMTPLPTPASFREAVAAARGLFPDQAVAADFAAATLQTLELGRRAPPAETLEVLRTLELKAGNELARIDALRVAARSASEAEALLAELGAAGLATEPATPVLDPVSNRPFAWRLSGGVAG